MNDLGRPFTDAGFGNKFREWCDQAGLHHCTAHGLRKAGATIVANNGATPHQLMAIFGWDTLKMAEAYTRAADQQRLAESAMHMLETPEQNSTESSHRGAWWGNFGKKRGKIKGQFRGCAQERTMQIALRRLEDELASYDKATRVAELPGGNQMVRLAADQGYANDQNSLAMMQRRSGRAAGLRPGDKVVSALGRSPNIDVLEDREDYKGFRNGHCLDPA